MKYNAKCTVWHNTDEGYIVNCYLCWWQDTEAQNITKTGKTDVDTAMVHLPLSAEIDKSDYIAKGTIDFEVTDSITELLKKVKPLKVSTVSRKDYGSGLLRHTEVTAR